jgi:CDGSH-type Zn-finger protein
MEKKKPMIITTKYNPFMVVDVEDVEGSDGKKVKMERVTSLCRCGESKSKPYCDGSHGKVGFVGEKEDDRIKDRVKDYPGNGITINDNRGVCSHDGSCVKYLPSVFKTSERPWIDAKAASIEDIIKTVERCPSGALSFTIGEKRYQDFYSRAPKIKIRKNGPLEVQGGVKLIDEMGSIPECKEHYTLCRCGKSKNKPFCDGTHDDAEFKG